MYKYKLGNNIDVFYDNKDYIKISVEITKFIWQKEFSSISFKLVQDTHKSIVYKFNYKDSGYYLKYYTPTSVRKILKNQFRKVEAKRHYNTAKGLQSVGISTVVPVLAIVKKNNFFYKESVFVMKEVNGITLEKYVQKNRICNNLKKELIEHFSDIYSKLVNYKYLHTDPTLSNFLIKEKHDNSIELVTIDVDNIYKLLYFPKRTIIYTLVKFYGRILYDLNRFNLQYLKEKDIYFFISSFLKRCNKSFNKNKLIDTIFKKVVKRLISLNQESVIREDELLKKMII